MKNVLKNIVLGISWGFTFYILVLLIGVIINKDFLSNLSQMDFIKSVICSALTGIAFTVPTIVYRNENFSRGVQILIHLGIGFTVYFPASIFAGWMPVKQGFAAVVLFLIAALFGTFVIWSCFYIYYKNEAKRINEGIKKLDEKK